MFKEWMKKYYHRHMDSVLLKKILRGYRRRERKDKKIKVVFICQMAQLWNKIEPVYQYMLDDPQFETLLLIVPDGSVDDENGQKSIEFFGLLKGNKVLAKNNEDWVSLKEINPDYVFYQRPYDHYLPECYRSMTVATYSRVSYIPYAYSFSVQGDEICLSGAFFDNLYLFFAETPQSRDIVVSKDIESYNKGRKKAYYLGYPALDIVSRAQPIIAKKEKEFLIMWTPRWTSDPYLGETHFFNYKDKIVELVKNRNDFSLIFRPHPMMFDNFINTGEISKESINLYLKDFIDNENLYYDTSASYYKTLWTTDVLITDTSTIIVEYLLTYKPIIFCNTSAKYVKNKFMVEILKVCYCADSWEEILKILEMLSGGNDPLKDARCIFVNKVLKNNSINSAKAIVESVKKDYYIL